MTDKNEEADLLTMPRDVLVALAGDDPQRLELLAAWDRENELRHAAEEALVAALPRVPEPAPKTFTDDAAARAPEAPQ